MNIALKHQKGLQFLSDISDNSVDLILTDPPYITSRDSGRDMWKEYANKQREVGAKSARTLEQWEAFFSSRDWDTFFDKQENLKKQVLSKEKRLRKKLTEDEIREKLAKLEEELKGKKKLTEEKRQEKLKEKEAKLRKVPTEDEVREELKKYRDERIAARLAKYREDYIKYGSIYGRKFAVSTDYGDWDKDFTMETLDVFINHFYRVLRPGGTCIIFFDLWKLSHLKEIMENCDERKRPIPKKKKENESEEEFKARKQNVLDNPLASYGLEQLRFIEWIKTNPQPINSKVNYLTNCREIALLGIKKSKPTFNSKYDKGIYEHPIQGGKQRFHPTQKSLPLFEELIKKHSNEGDLVLDCFAGSATTAVAAKNTGRNFIGCEMNEEYYNKSMERLNG